MKIFAFQKMSLFECFIFIVNPNMNRNIVTYILLYLLLKDIIIQKKKRK